MLLQTALPATRTLSPRSLAKSPAASRFANWLRLDRWRPRHATLWLKGCYQVKNGSRLRYISHRRYLHARLAKSMATVFMPSPERTYIANSSSCKHACVQVYADDTAFKGEWSEDALLGVWCLALAVNVCSGKFGTLWRGWPQQIPKLNPPSLGGAPILQEGFVCTSQLRWTLSACQEEHPRKEGPAPEASVMQ